MSQKFRAPKRRIESVRNILNTTITTSETAAVLHTAEDAQTLVRLILDLTITRLDAATSPAFYAIVIELEPGGVSVLNPSVTQILDNPKQINMIYEAVGHHDQTADNQQGIQIRRFVDLKSMRKLRESDTINFNTISDVASSFTLSGTVQLFFKE